MSYSSKSTTLPSITDLNSQSYDAFTSSINLLFEPAPPLATILYSCRPFTSYEHLISTATQIIFGNTNLQQLTFSQKLEVINAHPRLGENKKNLSALSLKEQGYLQNKNDTNDSSSSPATPLLTNEDEIVNSKLQSLNQQYEQKFGFRFVIFVNGRSRKEIIPILEDKLQNGNQEDELNRGLLDMMNIASDRLKKLVSS
ncbi:Oxo-4-hydroxy-4-carboxy-5-ureidoimidazoline decarboxylase [Gigaspora rosea]|uniref:Oxo-4-hydroxy-4-carboxy-5-ureidoimidazoline decarboxylase n=1 Tax=Gigaspora rosea TaxID=44941 RepID=A0A397V3E1_9GLOM|nr:Oxo-4-hydroxy-4-carboxy-5-ureidoimidazoline decarboxylase [Gigaspora rosea]